MYRSLLVVPRRRALPNARLGPSLLEAERAADRLDASPDEEG
jgi:hypothetical protein